MRAILCKEHGPPERLVLEEVESPSPGKGEVRIGVRACGVNFPDTLIIQGKYQFKPDLPFSPGSEISGEVLEVGAGVEGMSVGHRVLAVTGWGGFAEEVVTDAKRVLAMPDEMDDATGAAFAMAYGTSYHALVQRGELRSGETLLVIGASGGVGLAAVELGKVLGARVIAAGGSLVKLRAAKELGADEVISYDDGNLKDQVKELTGGQGADVIYDAVGGDAFDQAIRCINWKGRLLVVGFASGRIPQLPVNLVLLKGCQVVGVFWGAFREREAETSAKNFRELFRLYVEGMIHPRVSATYPLERAADALNALLAREVVGKIVLTTGLGSEGRA
ncbi:MAG: NADPH:quinone oxidoreductase family protein [Gemmatimonadota bacterium]